MLAPIVIFTDRDGDTLSVVPRDLTKGGDPVSDPIISITRHGDSRSVVMTDEDFDSVVEALDLARRGHRDKAALFCEHCGREIQITIHGSFEDVENPGYEVCELSDDYGPDHRPPFTVCDWKDVTVPFESWDKPFDTATCLGGFMTEDEAANFIDTLPEHETGRYSLDGPSDDA